MRAGFMYSLALFLGALFCLPAGSCPAETANYSIVYIHIGDLLPGYCQTSIKQARDFNSDCPIILAASKAALEKFAPQHELNVTLIPLESLLKTDEHTQFMTRAHPGGFWRVTSERFLYLNDLMVQYGLENVFHLEYDNMLYVNLEEILPLFQQQYAGISATFDNDDRGIAGFIYIRDCKCMQRMAEFFSIHAHGNNDMQLLAKYKNHAGEQHIDHLPIVMPEYVEENCLKSPAGHYASDKTKYCRHAGLFQSIFDAAALGQYLGGIDPRNGPSLPGFINESCVFNPSKLSYEWRLDHFGRKIPYALYANRSYRINNLHIHSKKLAQFASLPSGMP